MTLEELVHGVLDRPALVGQLHPDRAAVDVAFLVVHVAGLDQLLQVVRDVRALVVAA